jgi:hypothetical protein
LYYILILEIRKRRTQPWHLFLVCICFFFSLLYLTEIYI